MTNKSVLISIKPKWCELISNGKKTIEVRKTKPKIEVPFKCYIYKSKGKKLNNDYFEYEGNGKVIGEFVCDKIIKIKYLSTLSPKHGEYDLLYNFSLSESCLSESELLEYLGEPEIETNQVYLRELEYKAYSWHISDLKIYDEPKLLGEFNHCGENYHFNPAVVRPPQSWCYVESMEE